jgi:hypothetical protein
MSTPRRTTASTDAPPRRRSGSSPGTLIIIGCFILLFWVFITTIQIQSSEAFLNSTQQSGKNIFQPQWSIWLQIPKLLLGDKISGPEINQDEAVGIIVAWIIELFFVALIGAYEVTINASQKHGHFLSIVFRIISFAICIFDFWSDANYGNVSEGTHLAFAICCSAVVGFGLTWGIALIQAGSKHA